MDDNRTHFAKPADPVVEGADDIPAMGTIVAGKFRVEKLLGRGGMGFVVAARHMALGEQVAIKFLLPRVAQSAESVERFLREARASIRIKSEHVVRVSDVGKLEDGRPYMVMEHLEGADLAQVLEQEVRLPIAEAVGYILQAACAIAEAHALGIVHRDVKPSNLFLTTRTDGSPLVKVLDFGISKAVADQKDIDLTSTQAVFGSPRYMSPEQVRSAKNVDSRTDIWALAVVLYELIAGALPFDADTVPGILAKIVADAPVPLRSFRPEAPPELEHVFRVCLDKEIANRYQTLGELAVVLLPFAPTGSDEVVDRVKRMCAPFDVQSSSRRLVRSGFPSSSPDAAFGVTERAVTSESPKKRSPRAAVYAGCAAVLAVAAGAFVARGGSATPGPAAGPHDDSPMPARASTLAVIAPAAAGNVATPAASVVASASVSATAAPSAAPKVAQDKRVVTRKSPPVAAPSALPSTPKGAPLDPTQGRGD